MSCSRYASWFLLSALGVAQAPSPTAVTAAATVPRAPIALRLDFVDAGWQKAAQQVIDEVWAQADADFGAVASPGTLAMVVHGDLTSVDTATQKAGIARRPDLPGFVTANGRQGHVLLARDGWCRDARCRVAHVTMAMAVAVRFPPALPEWLRRGLPLQAEGDACVRAGAVPSRLAADCDGAAVDEVRNRLRIGDLPPLRQLLLMLPPEWPTDRQDHVARVLTLFLFDRHGGAMRTALRQARTSEQAFLTLILDAIAAAGGGDADALDTAFRQWVRELPEHRPIEIHPLRDAEGRPGDAAFVPATPAVHWLDRIAKTAFVLTARVTLVQGEAQGDVVFDRRDGRWLRVSFCAPGEVVVSERRDAAWSVLGRAKAVAAVASGVPFAVRVTVKGQAVQVAVGDQEVVALTVPGPGLAGRYGVGGPMFNQVAWKQVRVR